MFYKDQFWLALPHGNNGKRPLQVAGSDVVTRAEGDNDLNLPNSREWTNDPIETSLY